MAVAAVRFQVHLFGLDRMSHSCEAVLEHALSPRDITFFLPVLRRPRVRWRRAREGAWPGAPGAPGAARAPRAPRAEGEEGEAEAGAQGDPDRGESRRWHGQLLFGQCLLKYALLLLYLLRRTRRR